MKNFILLIFMFLLCGCAAYKYELAQKGYDGGFLVRRHGLLIPEYTIDVANKAPGDRNIAKQRFKRRKDIVNYYYKKMGRIYDDTLTRSADFTNLMTGPFRLPGAAIEDYKYEHDAEYREKVDAEQRKLEEEEIAIREKFKKELLDYIRRDMEFEHNLKY